MLRSIAVGLFCHFASTLGQANLAEPVDPATRALLKTFCEEFVEITPGRGKFPATFAMGAATGPDAERPVHDVRMEHDFFMARYEVPQNLYEAVMGENPSRWKGPRNSVEMFSFARAQEFCRRSTGLLRNAKLIADDEEIRLPSEAEWEYCCRAGTTTAYSFGNDATRPGETGKAASLLDPYAWHTGNAAGNDPPVGAKKPNAWGLYDMHGYLWEFVADAWHDNYRGAPADSHAWASDSPRTQRIVRGGSWKDRHELLKSAARRAVEPDVHDDAIGLRCVKARGP
ncbi:MAG: formylglycine-generating enzyme family protein [Planctomycetaceae bacterium]